MKDDILQHWMQNGEAWAATIAAGEIASRTLVTNQAIVEAILQKKPQRVLDVGCGEGWLCRALEEKGVQAVGVDGVPTLIDRARAQGGGTFFCLPYASCSPEEVRALGTFDVVAINYALFAQEVSGLLANLRHALRDGGHLIIQSVHPEHPALPGGPGARWIKEDWHMMQRPFSGSYQWYLHDQASWENQLITAGFASVAYQATYHPQEHYPVSLLLIASLT